LNLVLINDKIDTSEISNKITSPSQSKRKQFLKSSPTRRKCFLLCAVLLLFLIGVLIGVCILFTRSKMKSVIDSDKSTKTNSTNQQLNKTLNDPKEDQGKITVRLENFTRHFLSIYNVNLVLLNKTGWVRVWEDNFDWTGEVDLNKWEFDVGGNGWG
jgi:hypothetical protein